MMNNIDKKILIGTKRGIKNKMFDWWNKLEIKSALGHVGLLVTLMAYTAAGGLIFRHLEAPDARTRLTDLNQTLRTQRRHFVYQVANNTDLSNFELLVQIELQNYEKVFEKAVLGGIRIRNEDIIWEEWSLLRSVFFSSTVLTTIGYGHMVPRTIGGQLFCMLFALIGIPLTVTVIADWGGLFASAVSSITKHLPSLPRACSNTNTTQRTSLYAFAAICFLFVYLAAGAGLFKLIEDEWTFFDCFYFCFITMTTIGFGDLVPKQSNYVLLCSLYILIGLALTSTIIELVRRQYAQSWRTLQALSGPMAEAFKRMGETYGGAVDMTAFQQDLRKVLTVVSMPRWTSSHAGGSSGGNKDKEWEAAVEAVIRDIAAGAVKKEEPPPLVQIVIYESSV